jgi:hypothetical protein
MKWTLVVAFCLALIGGPLWARLPALTEEQKAAAEDAKAKAAESAKKEADLLGKYQDMTVEKYKKGAVTKGRPPSSR